MLHENINPSVVPEALHLGLIIDKYQISKSTGIDFDIFQICFSEGSIKCQYAVVLNTNNLTKTSLDDVIEYIRNNRTNEDDLKTIDGIGEIEVSETMKLMEEDLSKGKQFNIILMNKNIASM